MKRVTKVIVFVGTMAAALSGAAVHGYADSHDYKDKMENYDSQQKTGMMKHQKTGMMKHRLEMMKHHGGGSLFGGGANMNRDYTADEIRTLAEAFILRHGNENLKVGSVKEGPDNNYIVAITTKDDSLVSEMKIDKRTGHPSRQAKRNFRRSMTSGEE